MTISEIATKARALTSSDTTSYTDANILIDINIWYQKIVTMILESGDDIDFDDTNITATYPIFQRTLAARRDYAFSTAAWAALGKEAGSNASAAAILPLKIKRLDISWDGGTTWYKATPFDDGEYPYGLGGDAQTDTNFIKTAPRYDVKFNSVFIYPAPTAADVTAGAIMRLEQERNVIPFTSSDLSTGTAVPGFDAPFHPMIPAGAAWEYAISRQLPQLAQLTTNLQDWEIRLRQAYGRKDLDRHLIFKTAYDDSFGR